MFWLRSEVFPRRIGANPAKESTGNRDERKAEEASIVGQGLAAPSV
jgi:hypothetical protein